MGMSEEMRALLTREAESVLSEWKLLKKNNGELAEIKKLELRYNELRALLKRGEEGESDQEVVRPVPVPSPPPIPVSRFSAPVAREQSQVFGSAAVRDGHDRGVPTVNVNIPERTNSTSLVLAIFAFILALPALLISWIPMFGLLGLPLALLGGVLAFIGVIIALAFKGRGLLLPGLALLFSGFSVFLSIGISSMVANEISEAAEESNRIAIESNQVIDAPGGQEAEWAYAGTPVRQEDVQISIDAVSLGNVPVVNEITSSESVSDSTLLGVRLSLFNESTQKKLEYSSWNGKDYSFERDFATLQDNYGNVYKRVSFGFGENVLGSIESDSLYPGASVSDVLVFESPISNIEFLELELPASNFGGTGMIRFRIKPEFIGGI